MKQQVLRLSLLALVVGASTQSQAVYNLYSKDGLTLDINGQVDMQATKQDKNFIVLQNATELGYNDQGKEAIARRYSAGQTLSDVDRHTRLGQNHGVSYLDVRGAQVLPNDWRVTGNIGLNYDTDRQLYLSNSSLSLDKKNQGAISLGRQYLHTGYVGRTGTDTPLDIFSTSSIRIDYTAIDGLHASAYYSLAGSGDVRVADNQKQTKGFGASASYRHPVGAASGVRAAVGFTQAHFNPVDDAVVVNNPLNQYPAKTQGVAASLEYHVGSLLLAADVGRKTNTMATSVNTPLDNTKTDYLGAKVAYRINPVLQVTTGYGIKKNQNRNENRCAAFIYQCSQLYR